jgi:hypothetical protein
MNADRERELEAARAREREFKARERELQRNYEDLKSTIKVRLLSDSGAQDDTNWKEWWSEQVGSKWMNEKWEEYLPDIGSSTGVQELLLKEMRAEVFEEKERMAAEIERHREKEKRDADEEGKSGVPTAKSTGSVPMSKRLSRGSEVPNKAGYGGTTSKKDSGKQLGYLELITALSGLGYSANDSESAARRTNTVEAAENWIRENCTATMR